jgi:hypothetical protein
LDPCELKDCERPASEMVAVGHGEYTMIHAPTIQSLNHGGKTGGDLTKSHSVPPRQKILSGLSRHFFLSDRHLSSHSVEYGGRWSLHNYIQRAPRIMVGMLRSRDISGEVCYREQFLQNLVKITVFTLGNIRSLCIEGKCVLYQLQDYAVW